MSRLQPNVIMLASEVCSRVVAGRIGCDNSLMLAACGGMPAPVTVVTVPCALSPRHSHLSGDGWGWGVDRGWGVGQPLLRCASLAISAGFTDPVLHVSSHSGR